MTSKKYSEIGLFFCALFWGASGVLTQLALIDLTPMGLTFLRFLIASVVGLVAFRSQVFKASSMVYKHALALSVLLVIIYISSTYGLKYTSASNAGFIIGSAVILVPIINVIFFKYKLKKNEIICSIFCLIGLALVTLKGTNGFNKGDFYCFIDAVAYSLYIIYNSRLDPTVNTKALATLQYVNVCIVSFAYVFLFESMPQLGSIDTLYAVIILGVLCTFLTFFIQMLAQKHTTAESASRILTFIPIFTVLFDMLVFHVQFTPSAAIGGLFVILSTLLVDFKFKKRHKIASDPSI